MKTRTCLISFVALGVLLTGCQSACRRRADRRRTVRQPAVAGAFYPGDRRSSARSIDGFLAQANPPAIEAEIRALVVPHAGYVYSAPGRGVRLQGDRGQAVQDRRADRQQPPRRLRGASVYNQREVQDAARRRGDRQRDSRTADRARTRTIFSRESPHIPEHSLEVQLPFLQKTLGTFKLVPILLGTESREAADILGDALAAKAGPDTLVIASTDMSHYPPYEYANFADGKVGERHRVRERGQPRADSSASSGRWACPNAATFLCGEGAVKAVMHYAEQDRREERHAAEVRELGRHGGLEGPRRRILRGGAFQAKEGRTCPRSRTRTKRS